MVLLYQTPKFCNIKRNEVVLEHQRGASHPRDANLLIDHPNGPYFTSRARPEYTNNPGAVVLNTVSRFKTLLYIFSNFISPTDRPRLGICCTLRRTICHPIRPRILVTNSTIIPTPSRESLQELCTSLSITQQCISLQSLSQPITFAQNSFPSQKP
jgi:hypothetical protein